MDARGHLHTCVSDEGFLASGEDTANYRRVWARDGVITGLGALATKDASLERAFDRTLKTLARPGRAGQIPSNVSPDGVSYGTRVGRVDASAWFLVGVGAARRAGREVEPLVELARGAAAALVAWELNDGGLVYVPRGGDWADEYLHSGYGLFTNCVRLWGLRLMGLDAEASRIEAALTDGFAGRMPLVAAFEPGREYAYFDAFGTALWCALGLPDARALLEDALARRVHGLVPAFDPPVRPSEADYALLQGAASSTLRNTPGAYHNGGLWPVVNGFVAVALRRCGLDDEADALAGRVHEVNDAHGFPEFLGADEGTPGGVGGMAWSAAGELLATDARYGPSLFGA